MGFWSMLFGRDAEIDYSKPLGVSPSKPWPHARKINNGSNVDVKVTVDGELPVIVSPGCSIEVALDSSYTVETVPQPAKPRALKKLAAHGTAPSKPKRRSPKKPSRKSKSKR